MLIEEFEDLLSLKVKNFLNNIDFLVTRRKRN